jgi:hypothetical protein
MSNSFVVILIAGGIGIIVACVIVYYILRFMRGSITITLPRTAFNPGEKIAGSLELTTRKNIEGQRLYVALIGQQVTEIRKKKALIWLLERGYQSTWGFDNKRPKTHAKQTIRGASGDSQGNYTWVSKR